MDIELVIFEDCLDLINKFVDSNNQTFKSFCEKWQEVMFQYVYAVQTTSSEVIQTTKAIFNIAKRCACGEADMAKTSIDKSHHSQISRRIGGIYLMYAVYFKQPTKQYVKILMSQNAWDDLVLFVESLQKNKMQEVQYIFWKLYKNDAFRFTANDYDFGLENFADYDQLFIIHNGNKFVDNVGEKLKQKLFLVREAEMCVPSMVSLEEKYNQFKQSILSSDKSMKHLPSTRIFSDIQDGIKSIQDILDDKKSDNSEQNIALKELVINTGEKRKELKRKAAGYTTNDESADEIQSPIETPKIYTAVRKFVTQELPEFINVDLKNNSSEDED